MTARGKPARLQPAPEPSFGLSKADDQPFTVQIAPAVGDEVELTEGPLNGVKAVITRLLPGARRVQILMDFLGSSRQMEVPLQFLIGSHDPRVAAFAGKP